MVLPQFHHRTTHDERAEEATKKFARTLASAFDQYQELWEENLKLSASFGESQQKVADLEHKLRNGEKKEPTSQTKNPTTLSDNTQAQMFCTYVSEETKDKGTNVDSVQPYVIYDLSDVSSFDFENDDLQNDDLEKYPRYRDEATPKRAEDLPSRGSPILCRNRRVIGSKSSLDSDAGERNPTDVSACEDVKNSEVLRDVKSIDPTPPEAPLMSADDRRAGSFFIRQRKPPAYTNKKSSGKLSLVTTYNVNTEISSSGKKSKQAKLIFQRPSAKTDLSFQRSTGVDVSNRPSTADLEITLFNASEDSFPNWTESRDNVGMNSTMFQLPSSPSSTRRFDEKRYPRSEADVIIISPSLLCAQEAKVRADLETKNGESCEGNIVEANPLWSKFSSRIKKVKRAGTRIEYVESFETNKRSARNKCSLVGDENREPRPLQNCPSSGKKPRYLRNSTEDVAKKSKLPPKRQSEDSLLQSTSLNMCNDETFFLPAEISTQRCLGQTNDANQPHLIDLSMGESKRCTTPPFNRALLGGFDEVPERKKTSPKRPHKCEPTRSKSERAKLVGWSCWQCKEYYEGLGLSEEELQVRKNQCSRHKGRCKEKYNTPKGFWNPVFPDTYRSSYEDE